MSKHYVTICLNMTKKTWTTYNWWLNHPIKSRGYQNGYPFQHIQYNENEKKNRCNVPFSCNIYIYIYIYYYNIPIKYPSIIQSYSMYHLVISYIILHSHRKIHHAIKNGKGTPSINRLGPWLNHGSHCECHNQSPRG